MRNYCSYASSDYKITTWGSCKNVTVISSPWSSNTQKSKKCSAKFLTYASCYCKACVMFSVLQDLQQKQSHTTHKKCTYRVIDTSKWQCKWCSFLYYSQHLLQALSCSSQHFTPALSEGLGDGAARGTPWPLCCLRPPEPSCSSSSQELGQHTPHF